MACPALRVEVADTGKGVPDDAATKLFRPFAQLQIDNSGSGLGLLSVKTKIELLGGQVGVKSNHPRKQEYSNINSMASIRILIRSSSVFFRGSGLLV